MYLCLLTISHVNGRRVRSSDACIRVAINSPERMRAQSPESSRIAESDAHTLGTIACNNKLSNLVHDTDGKHALAFYCPTIASLPSWLKLSKIAIRVHVKHGEHEMESRTLSKIGALNKPTQIENDREWRQATYFDVTTFSRVSSGALAGEAADVIGALSIVQTGVRFAFVVLEIAQFTGKACRCVKGKQRENRLVDAFVF